MRILIPVLLTVGTLAAIYAIAQVMVELVAPLLPGVRRLRGQPTQRGWRRIPRVA